MTTYSPWSNPRDPHILFPIGPYNQLLNHLNEEDNSKWLNNWTERGGAEIASSSWPLGTKRDWTWGIGLPFLSDIERYLLRKEERTLFGISGLPGCGKTSFGTWIKAATAGLNWSVDVISMDDFYFESKELEKAMSGNPWLVPRALPGSHEIELMKMTIENWKSTGNLKSPRFDKALRNGLGDRCGWNISTPKILVIEGWFLGCGLSVDTTTSEGNSFRGSKEISLDEKNYQKIVQKFLKEYQPIWDKFERIWHLKAIDFKSAREWKSQQEKNLQRDRGASIKGKSLELFLRMIETAIPKEDLQSIKSDVLVKLNSSREITWVGLRKKDLET